MFRNKFVKIGIIAISAIVILWLVVFIIVKAGGNDTKRNDGIFRIQTSSYPMYTLTLNITSRSQRY